MNMTQPMETINVGLSPSKKNVLLASLKTF